MKVVLLMPSHDTSWDRVEHLGMADPPAVLRQAGHEVHALDSFLEDLDIR